MKNILQDRPSDELSGRLHACANFVDDTDVRDKTVLDIGCGYGWCEVNFLKRGVDQIIGTELSEKDLETAKKFINDSRVEFEVGNAIKLPFEDNSFDTVVSWDVIEHIPKNTEVQMLKEVHRVLKKDGVFYLSTPYASFWSKALDPAWWLVGHRHYSIQYFEGLAEKTGFNVERAEAKGRLVVLLGDLNMYIAKWIFRRHSFFQDWFKERVTESYKKRGYVTVFHKFVKSS